MYFPFDKDIYCFLSITKIYSALFAINDLSLLHTSDLSTRARWVYMCKKNENFVFIMFVLRLRLRLRFVASH